MRKIITICICLFVAMTASAQFVSGDMLIKGNIGFNTIGSSDSEQNVSSSSSFNSITINPQFEYFVSDRASIGFSAGFSNLWAGSKHSEQVYGDRKSRDGVSVYYVGPTYNYYIKVANKFYFSVDCFLGYAGLTVSSMVKTGSNKQKESSCGNAGVLQVTPTFNYFINDKWLLMASIGNLNAMYGKVDGATGSIHSFGVNYGDIKLGVGFKF